MTDSKELTPWFPMSVEPAREGVYDVGAGMYSEYRNGVWLGTTRDLRKASSFGRRFGKTTMPLSKWRGLAKDPS